MGARWRKSKGSRYSWYVYIIWTGSRSSLSLIEGPGGGAQTGSFGALSPWRGLLQTFSEYSYSSIGAGLGPLCTGSRGVLPSGRTSEAAPPLARSLLSIGTLYILPCLVCSLVPVPTSAAARVCLPSTSSRPNSQLGPGRCWAGQKDSAKRGLDRGPRSALAEGLEPKWIRLKSLNRFVLGVLVLSFY